MVYGKRRDPAATRPGPAVRQVQQRHGITAAGQGQGDRPIATGQAGVEPRGHLGRQRITGDVGQSHSARSDTWPARLR